MGTNSGINSFWGLMETNGLGPGGITLETALFSLLLAFVLSQFTAWVYIYTHHGLSYSRSFVQSIVLLTMVLALGLMIIGNNIAVAFGLVGALSVIRFRNILKDTRDTSFIFFSLITSLACGTRNYELALLGTATFCSLAVYLHWSKFGSRKTGDGFVRFYWNLEQVQRMEWQTVLNRHCRNTELVSQRFHEGNQGEVACRLTMRDPSQADRLVEDLRQTDGISHVTFVLQEEEAEV